VFRSKDSDLKIQRYARVEVAYQVLSSWKITTLRKANCKLQVVELTKTNKNYDLAQNREETIIWKDTQTVSE
jgi:hypothetical protein